MTPTIRLRGLIPCPQWRHSTIESAAVTAIASVAAISATESSVPSTAVSAVSAISAAVSAVATVSAVAELCGSQAAQGSEDEEGDEERLDAHHGSGSVRSSKARLDMDTWNLKVTMQLCRGILRS